MLFKIAKAEGTPGACSEPLSTTQLIRERSHETNPKKCMVHAGTCSNPTHFPMDGIQDELKTVPRKKNSMPQTRMYHSRAITFSISSGKGIRQDAWSYTRWGH